MIDKLDNGEYFLSRGLGVFKKVGFLEPEDLGRGV